MCIDSTTCWDFNPCLQIHSPGKKTECWGWLTVQYLFDMVSKGSLIWLFCGSFSPLFFSLILHLVFPFFQYLPPGIIKIMIQMYTQPMSVLDYGVQDGFFWGGKNLIECEQLLSEMMEGVKSRKHFCCHVYLLICTTRKTRRRLGYMMQKMKRQNGYYI